jgi:hypothetical protein
MGDGISSTTVLDSSNHAGASSERECRYSRTHMLIAVEMCRSMQRASGMPDLC